jgi:hypothetical protein
MGDVLELGYQFMFFAEGRIKLPPGSRGSIKGVPIASRLVSVDTVSIGIAVFQTIPRRIEFNVYASDCNSIFRMRCHSRIAKRRMIATNAIFFFFGLRSATR